VLFDVLCDLLLTLLSLPPGDLGGHPEGLLPARLGEDCPQVRRQFFATLGSHHAEEVPRVVDLAALPRCSLEVANHGGLQALMVVRDHQLNALEPPGF
jgi:hypothetical protein